MKVNADFSKQNTTMYLASKETALLRFYEPNPGLFVAESLNVILRALEKGYEPVSFLVDEDCLDDNAEKMISDFNNVPAYIAKHDDIKTMTGYPMTRGVLSLMRRKKLPNPFDVVSDARRIVILEDVMNPTNLGAIFRSAAALSMDAVLLTGGCTDPLYRRASRVSMGTVFQIPWTGLSENGIDSPSKVNLFLKENGFKSVAFALRNDSVDITDPVLKSEDRLAVFLGTEGDGLCEETMSLCDYTVKIPMSHGVDSLNVAAASAIAFWELGRWK